MKVSRNIVGTDFARIKIPKPPEMNEELAKWKKVINFDGWGEYFLKYLKWKVGRLDEEAAIELGSCFCTGFAKSIYHQYMYDMMKEKKEGNIVGFILRLRKALITPNATKLLWGEYNNLKFTRDVYHMV